MTLGSGEVLAMIPLADGTEASVTDDMVDEWQKAFPGVDVRAELGRIRVYFLTNPRKRKTAAGIGRCITGWLGRTQDRGGGRFRGVGDRDPPRVLQPAPGKYDGIGIDVYVGPKTPAKGDKT